MEDKEKENLEEGQNFEDQEDRNADVSPDQIEVEDETLNEVVTFEQYKALKEAFEEVKHQNDENSDGWQRERADFANYKKRIQRDHEAQRRSMKGDIIKKFLPVLDDLDRALKNRPADKEGAAWADGMELVYKKFNSILEAEGVKMIDADNKEFDPNLHEAITHEESPDHESGQIIEVLQQGYYIDDKVLRPSMVRVAK